jgi:ribonuclease HI
LERITDIAHYGEHRHTPGVALSRSFIAATNNIAELTAIGLVFHHLDTVAYRSSLAPVFILTDSRYARDAITGMNRAHVNTELVMELRHHLSLLRRRGLDITFHWVRSHAHLAGNEHVDRLAKLAATATSTVTTRTHFLSNTVPPPLPSPKPKRRIRTTSTSHATASGNDTDNDIRLHLIHITSPFMSAMNLVMSV